MVEVVVVLAIMTTISSIVLVNFSGLSDGSSISRAARELGLEIRKAQNMSLAVSLPPSLASIPPAVGVEVSTLKPTSYFIFADYRQDNIFTSDDTKIGSDETLPGRVVVNSLKDSNNPSNSYTILDIVFASPEAVMHVSACCDAFGSRVIDPREPITISLTTPSGAKRSLIVRSSGQISIK